MLSQPFRRVELLAICGVLVLVVASCVSQPPPPQPAAPTVERIALFDAATDQPIAGYEDLTDGTVLDYAVLGTTDLAFRAFTDVQQIHRVDFTLDGAVLHSDAAAPFTFPGDENDGADLLPITPPLPEGPHTLTAVPIGGGVFGLREGDPYTVSFEIGAAAPGGDVSGCIPSPSQFDGAGISPLSCDQVKVFTPYVLDWNGDLGGVPSGASHGTGFTMILPTSLGGGWLPSRTLVDTAAGTLDVTSTSGWMLEEANDQDNALGVGLDLPNEAVRVEATLQAPPPGSGAFEKAGIWFGISERDHVELAFVSAPGGTEVRVLLEQADEVVQQAGQSVDPAGEDVTLAIIADPAAESVTAVYRVGAGAEVQIATWTGVPSQWFSKDAAGIDISVGTRSFGGIVASHGNAAVPVEYAFASFAVTEHVTSTEPPPPPPDTTIDFATWTFSSNVDLPTALAWGPDRRLYVAEVSGPIRAFTLDHLTRTVVAAETYGSLGPRTLLGLAIDPASTPDDVILWASHSSSSLNAGEANSGVVSRLSGPGFATVEDVIVGLPRAIANHAPNELHFGPDGRLYIAIGGNTGAGAANDGGSEFGPRPEQPLSAALVVADVYAPGFDGTCASEVDPDGSIMDATGISATDVPCDVEVYASGLRNSYDFTFHRNGHLYATDNGLGVEGTFPDLQPDDLSWTFGDGCEGPIEGQAERDAHNPGARHDLLLRVEQGDYFGHPNPSRGECVFYAGNPTSSADEPVPTSPGFSQAYMETTKYVVGVQPEPTWTRPIRALGTNRSANGIIEYVSESFCGPLSGDLLITYYSVGDQVRRVRLSTDGTSVLGDEPLRRSTSGTGGLTLRQPLPITQDPLGRIYVGEFGNNGRISVFDPIGPGCWQTQGVADLPVALLDAGGAAIADRLYLVGGKTSAAHQRTLWIWDAWTNAWSAGAELPAAYPAVENPAVVASGGFLYVFGGSTSAFSGATTKAARYDPVADAWTLLPDMPTARAGAVVQLVGGRFHVAGGMNGSGSSLRSMDIYDPTSASWSAGPAMSTYRDNPGSAAIGGEMYVFGGRTRNVSGLADVNTLATAEVFDPVTQAWTGIATMPTGRRAMSVVVVDGEALVLGGEATSTGGAFDANQAYDPVTDAWRSLPSMPVGRHGAGAGRIGNGVVVAGGGTTAGSSFTADVDVFRYR